jgi:hypothetical protein
MGKRDGRQKGPQQHAEGQHGERTHSRFLEQIHQPMDREEDLAAAAGVERSDEDRRNAEDSDDAGDDGGRDRQRR